jgi:glycogen debranching enzyme
MTTDTTRAEDPVLEAPHLVNLSETTVAKDGNVFSVTMHDGSLPVGEDHPLGVYADDCRVLSGHELRIGGVRPLLLVTSESSGAAVVHELTNPPLALDDGRVLPLQTLRVRLERTLDSAGGMTERVVVHSYSLEPLELELDLQLDADLESMLAIRGIIPRATGRAEASAANGVARFSRRGRDGVVRSTTMTASPAPEGEGLRFPLKLAPGGDAEVSLRYTFETAAEPREHAPLPGLETAARVTVDDELIQRVLQRSMLDLGMLRSQFDGRRYFSAGVPWYATLFGRDSLITAMQVVAFAPGVAEQTLRVLASLLGRRHDPFHEEEPGKVLHEMRVGEVAAPGVTPLARYYGTVDATPLFLCLLCEHADWTGSLELFRELRPQVEAMLGWIDGPADRDGDGLLDYAASAPGGLRNQGWKDSDEGVCDEHGIPLEPPIALVEAQAYVVRAKRRLARLLALDGDADRAARLRDEAEALAGRIERFWLADRSYYSMGIDGEGRPSEALASNQGHLLWALAVPPERARAIRDAVMNDRMFAGWGIRTLAAGEAAFNPVGYHLGSVWPHDTALIAVGLRKYGFDEDFNRTFEALLEAASHSAGYRLPELYAGFSRGEFATPVPYPVACQPQAWAAGAIPYMLKSGLGLNADALANRLRILRPSLPRWVNRVEVRGLRVAESSVDLLFERAGTGSVTLSDVRIDGDVEVTLEIRGSRETTPLSR